MKLLINLSIEEVQYRYVYVMNSNNSLKLNRLIKHAQSELHKELCTKNLVCSWHQRILHFPLFYRKPILEVEYISIELSIHLWEWADFRIRFNNRLTQSPNLLQTEIIFPNITINMYLLSFTKFRHQNPSFKWSMSLF